jgi:hypothetical protein
MNKATHRVAADESEQPKNQENNRQCVQHTLFLSFQAVRLPAAFRLFFPPPAHPVTPHISAAVFIQVPRAFNNLFRTVDFWIRTSAERAGLQLISVPFQLLQSSCATVALTILGLLMPKPYGVTPPFDMGHNPFDKCPKHPLPSAALGPSFAALPIVGIFAEFRDSLITQLGAGSLAFPYEPNNTPGDAPIFGTDSVTPAFEKTYSPPAGTLRQLHVRRWTRSTESSAFADTPHALSATPARPVRLAAAFSNPSQRFPETDASPTVPEKPHAGRVVRRQSDKII